MKLRTALTLAALAGLMSLPLLSNAQGRGRQDSGKTQTSRTSNSDRGSSNRGQDLGRGSQQNNRGGSTDRSGGTSQNRGSSNDNRGRNDNSNHGRDSGGSWNQGGSTSQNRGSSNDNRGRNDNSNHGRDSGGSWNQGGSTSQNHGSSGGNWNRGGDNGRTNDRSDQRNNQWDRGNHGFPSKTSHDPVIVNRGSDRDWGSHRFYRSDRRDWRDIAFVGGFFAEINFLSNDSRICFDGSSGDYYPLWQYDQDLNSSDADCRARAEFFDQAFFYRDGHRYERRIVTRNGERCYQFFLG